jgi:hypothetical protein
MADLAIRVENPCPEPFDKLRVNHALSEANVSAEG